MNATHDSLVRPDRRGRLRYTSGQREALLNAYDSSGLSGPKFAALHGVKYQTFAAWLQRRKRSGAASGLPVPDGLTLVQIEAPMPSAHDDGLRLRFPGGVEIHVASRASVPLTSEAATLTPANWLRARQEKPARKAA